MSTDPARNDRIASIAIRGNCADKGPELVVLSSVSFGVMRLLRTTHLIQQWCASVVSNTSSEAITRPCSNGIPVVKTCYRRRNEGFAAEELSARYADLLHPRLVEGNFL